MCAAVRIAFVLLLAVSFTTLPSAHGDGDAAVRRVVVLVDESAYPGIEAGLERYQTHVRNLLPIRFEVVVKGFYSWSPTQIRALLKERYEVGDPPLAGAIIVGALPFAELDTPAQKVYPAPLYYEDFDAVWYDHDDDGDFDQFETDRQSNSTEIWTAWWIPPSNDRAEQHALLAQFLSKLDRYYRGDLVGRHALYFGAGKAAGLRVSQGWSALLLDGMRTVAQRLKAYNSRIATCMSVHPAGPNDFTAAELVKCLTQRRWQHAHINTFGRSDGFYWLDQEVTIDTLNLKDFNQSGGNIVTTSGSCNANYRGTERGPADFTRCLGNRIVFSERTATVAWFGPTTPQASGSMPSYHADLIEALNPGGESYLAAGYHNMRNGDHCWGLRHYLFRGVDEKALLGDPFARYRSDGSVAP